MRTSTGISKMDLTSVRGKIVNNSHSALSQHSRGTRSALKIQDSKHIFEMNQHKRSLSKQGLKQLPGQRHDALKKFALDQLSLLSEIQQKEDAEERLRESTFDQRSNLLSGSVNSKDTMRSNILKNLKRTHTNSKSQGGAKSLLLRNKALINDDYQLTTVSPQAINQGPVNPIMQLKQEKEVAQQKALQRPYNINVQKQFLVRQIRDRLRKEFQNMYRNAENAYNTLDFTGLGYIKRDEFMNCIVIKDRIPWNVEHINIYLKDFNLFQNDKNGMDFDTFKKNYFPHTYLAQDPADDADDKVAKKNRDDLSDPSRREETQAMIEERLKKLETKLKLKFQNCYHSVRKAFLALDTDYDGYITVEDILKYFGNETELNYNDLLKLMIDHDASKQGRIDYSDFSKWFGNAIHMSSGFYFRHDSKKNPDFDMQLEKDKKANDDNRHKAAQSLLTGDLEFMILEKMKIQWKTIRKAFTDINLEKTGAISKTEFKFFLNYWGIEMTEAQFEQIFAKFDLDGDGKISFKDFQLSIGSDMFPAEGLYFRQEKKQSVNKCVERPVMFKVNCCQHPECWQPVANNSNYCDVHQKMHSDESAKLFSKIFKQFGNKWKNFIEEIKLNSDKDDQRQILFKDFNQILIRMGYKLTEENKNLLLKALPGKASGDGGQRLNVSRIYDQKYTNILDKMYYKFDSDKFVDNALTDEMGYLGKSEFYREKNALTPIDEEEFLYIIFKGKKLKDIMLMVKEIDPQRNGYVTSYELDDIIKILHPQELQKKNLKPIISKFESLQNKILIDYKQFRDWILLGLSNIQDKENMKDHIANNKKLSDQISQLETQINHHKKSEGFISHKIDEQASRASRRIDEQASRASSKLTKNDQDEIQSNKYIKLSQRKNIENDAKNFQFGQRASSCINGFRPSPKESLQSHPLQSIQKTVKAAKNFRFDQDDIRSRSMLEEQNDDAQSIGSKYVNVSKLVTSNKQKLDSTYDRSNGRAVTAIRTRNDEPRQSSQLAVAQSTQIKNERLRNIARHKSNTGLERAESLSELSQQNFYNPQLVNTDEQILRKIVEFSLDYDITKNQNMNATHEMQNNLREQNNASLTRQRKSNTQLNFVTAAKLDEEISQNGFQTPQRFVNKKISKNDEQIITNKLAYEWKNIFRQLTVDGEGSNSISINTFDKACLKVGVNFTKEELKKINNLFGESNQNGTITETDMINFHQISNQLGLHRGSYNYLNQSISSNRAKSMHKLQQLYQSIDPVEELDEIGEDAEAKPVQTLKSRPKSSHSTFHKKSKSYIMRNNSIKHNKTFLKTRQLANSLIKTDQNRQDSNNNQFNMTSKQDELVEDSLAQNIKTQEPTSIFKSNSLVKVPFNSRVSKDQAKPQHIRRQVLKNNMMQNIQAHQSNNQNRPESVGKQSVKAPSQQGLHSSTAFGTTSQGQRIKSGAFGENKTSNGPLTFADAEWDNNEQIVNTDLKIRTRPNTSVTRFLRKPSESQQVVRQSLPDQRETISNVLRAKGNLQKLRDLVQIHLKKKDLQNQIILNAQTMQESDKTIIAINSFRQCLQALNIQITDQLLQQFIVKGEVKLRKENDSKSVMNGMNEFDDKKSTRSALSGVKSIRSFKSMNQTQSKIMAVISASGTKTLGVDVQQFINTYA